MRSLRLLLGLAFAGLVPFARAELPSRPRFDHELSDLAADARVRFGRLPNGVHYAVMANHEPRQRASIRLLVLAGSAQETEDQLGLAHFVEHMAFNGTTHYAPGTLIEYFQRLGMSFGGDTNANTTLERTVYLLELPNTEKKTLEEAWTVIGDYARGELIQPTEVDSERRIILSEKRDRDSVEYRRQVALEEFMFGQTLIAKRLPIGTAEVISNAKPSVLRAYYDTWYRPDRMAVVAVGDFDAAAVEAQIKERFATLKAADIPEPKDPALGEIPELKTDRALYRHEPEAGATSVMVYSVTPYAREIDSRALRRKYLPRTLALQMLNRRLSILSRKPDAPFIDGGAQVDETLDFCRVAGFQFSCKPENWAAALRVGETELRRALEHGFAPAELKEAVSNYRHSLEESVKTAPTRHSDALADHLVDSMLEGYVFTTPEESLAAVKDALETVKAEDCMKSLREAFPAAGRYIAVVGNVEIAPKPSDEKSPPKSAATPEEQILAVYREAATASVDASSAIADEPFAYTDFGPAGTVEKRQHVDDLDVDLLTLSNGVKLNLKKTDFEANRVHFSVRIGAGKLTEPADKPGLGMFSAATFISGGLGKHSIDDIIRLAAGRTVGLGFDAGADALVVSATTNREDLLFQLQLIAAYLTDAGYRPEALETARKNFEPVYRELEHTPSGPIQLKVMRDLASGDPRFGVPAKEALMARTLEESKAWLEPQLKHGAIEIALVGDLDPDAAIKAVAQTLGALPKRDPKPTLEAAHRVKIPAEPFAREYTVQTEIPRGLVALYWPSTDARDVHRDRRARMLADVFTDRLRVEIREKLGDAYSPSAFHSADDVYWDYGWFGSYIDASPDKLELIRDSVVKIAADLAEHGVTTEELERARQPVLTALRQSARTNGYWLHAVLQAAQENPKRLEWSRDRYADNEAISKADLDAIAKQCLGASRVFRVIVRPAANTPAAAAGK